LLQHADGIAELICKLMTIAQEGLLYILVPVEVPFAWLPFTLNIFIW
jgi:hypothetical protein